MVSVISTTAFQAVWVGLNPTTCSIQPNEAMLVEKPLRVSKNYLRLTNLHIDNQFTLQSCSYLMKSKKESLLQYIPLW